MIWRGDGGEQRIGDLNFAATALALDGPFEGNGSLSHAGTTWTVKADLGRVSKPQIPINLVLQSGTSASLNLVGTVDLSKDSPAFSGQVEADAQQLGTLVGLAPGAGDAVPAAFAAMPFSLDARLSASAEALRLADIAVALGDTKALGDAEFAMGDKPSADVTLAASKLDLDALLAAAGASGAAGDAGPTGVPALPENLSGGVDLSVDVAAWRGGTIRQIHAIAAFGAGKLTVQQFNAQLPGGTDISISGDLGVEDGVPTFRGPVEVTADNLRATLDWAGVALPDMAQDRLRRVDLFAKVVATPSSVAASGMDLRFDSSRLTGSASVTLGDRPAIGADVTLDHINLDGYLPPQAPSAGSAGGAAAGFAMPQLPAVDLDLKARVDQLTYNGVPVAGFVADGTLKDGRLDLRSLGAADVAGAALRTSGTIDPAARTIDMQFGVKAPEAGSLLRLLGITLPIDPARLGAVEMVAEVKGGTDQAVINSRLDTGLGQAQVEGTLLDPLGTPGFDGRVGLRAASYRTLAQALNVDLPDAANSEIAVAADVTTDGDKADLNAVLQVLGLSLRGSGTLTALQTTPAFDLRLLAEHEELGTLLADLGAGTKGHKLGPLKLSLAAKGDVTKFDVTVAPSTIGSSDLHGTVTADLTGVRPSIDGRFEAGDLALDPFLAASSGGTVGEGTAASGGQDNGGRWSSEEIDLSALKTFDGHLELVADSATLQGMTFGKPTIVATLKDGTLDLERFDGTLFDGQVQAKGTVVPGLPNTIALDVALANADMAQALQHFAQSDRVSGRLFLDTTVTASGLSQRDLVGSLAGDGSLSLRDGVVQGFDLKRISDRLGSLDNEVAIVALLGDAASGGQTRITAADGTLKIDKGVVRSDDLRVIMEGGQATFTLAADLPRWWLDLQGTAELTQHPKAPKIPITVRGPIDAPQKVVDTSALQAWLVQRAASAAASKLGVDTQSGAAGTILNAITGGASGGTTDTGQGSTDTGQSDGSSSGGGSLLETPPTPPEEPNTVPLDTQKLLQDLLNNVGN